MTTFTTKEILEAGELFRPVTKDFRGLVTGVMMGLNMAVDKESLPDMVNIAMIMLEDKSA